MTITYEITTEDLRLISAEGAKSTSLYTIYSTVALILAVVFMLSDLIIVIVANLLNDGSAKVESLHILARIIIAFAIFAIMYFGGKLVSRRAFKKALKTPGKNGLFCEHTISLDDDGFTESTEVNRNFNSWDGVDEVGETDSFVTLKLRLGPTYYVPKRSFVNREAIRAFLIEAESHLLESSRRFSKKASLDY